LIAKWYLGGPLTKSRMTKWSMDDMSLPFSGLFCYLLLESQRAQPEGAFP